MPETESVRTRTPHYRKMLLTREEAAELCSMSVRKFSTHVAAGDIPQPVLGSGEPGTRGSRWSRFQLEAYFSRR